MYRNRLGLRTKIRPFRGKYQSKMIGLCDWTFETKVFIACDSFFRKPISVVYCLSLLEPTTLKPDSI